MLNPWHSIVVVRTLTILNLKQDGVIEITMFPSYASIPYCMYPIFKIKTFIRRVVSLVVLLLLLLIRLVSKRMYVSRQIPSYVDDTGLLLAVGLVFVGSVLLLLSATDKAAS